LSGVVILGRGLDGVEGATLDADHALDHPLLKGWIEPSLGQALAAPVRAGVRGYHLAPAAPTFGFIVLTMQSSAVMAGNVYLNWNGATANLSYGHAVHQPVVTTITIDGSVLLRTGVAARVLTSQAYPLPPEPIQRPRRLDLH
jgi:hypothetical protein